MENDLLRVESAITATASGDLTWERWTHDVAVAMGFAGQRNPLGFAVVRYLSDEPSVPAMWNLVLVLAKNLERAGCPGAESRKVASAAFDWWRDSRCGYCAGRGVTGQDQRQCPYCAGTGQRRQPDSPEILRVGISLLIEAEQWMEGQLRARLKRDE